MSTKMFISILLSSSILVSLPITNGRKIRERYSGLAKNLTLRVLLPTSQTGTLSKETMAREGSEFCDTAFSLYKDWDTVEFVGMNVGQRQPNGSYDGIIGAAVEGRGDFIFQFVNPSDFDVDTGIPVKLGPIAFDGSLAIVSASKPGNNTMASLLDFFETSVDGDFYYYTIIWTIIFIITNTIIVTFLWKDDSIPEDAREQEQTFKGLLEVIKTTVIWCLWMIAEIFLLTDSSTQLNSTGRKTYSLTILTFSLILCVFYALDMVMWSFLSAELTVESAVKHVDSIDDLISSTFVPVILTDFGALSYLKRSNNAEEKRLYNYLMKFPPSSRISLNSGQTISTFAETEKIALGIMTGTMAFIERRESFQYAPLMCYHNPDSMKNIHISRKSFGGGYFTYALSPHMLAPLVADLHFHLTNLMEMGIISKGISQKFRTKAYEVSEMIESPLKGLICESEFVEKVSNDPTYSQPEEVKPFTIPTLWQVFLIHISGMIFSLVAIIMEKGMFRMHEENVLSFPILMIGIAINILVAIKSLGKSLYKRFERYLKVRQPKVHPSQ